MLKKSKDLFGHSNLLNSLIESYNSDTLSNSIIISGNKGIGKRLGCGVAVWTGIQEDVSYPKYAAPKTESQMVTQF